MKLRNGQQKAIEMLYKYFQHNAGNPVLEAPTAAGKSVIQAFFIKGILDKWKDNKFLCLTHSKELVEQNYLKMVEVGAGLDCGVYAASLKRRDTKNKVIFASIQSVYGRAFEFDKIDIIIIDECHLCPVKTSDGMYRKFINQALLANPCLKVIGLSATPYRLDNGLLTEGENRLFTDIIPAKACEMSIDNLLELGYLSPLTTEPVKTHLDTSEVRKRGGDYVQSQLAKAVDVDHITAAACEEILTLAKDRKSWLVFGTSIEHAGHINDYLAESGISCATITGKTPGLLRDQLIQQFKAGRIRCLVNVNVLTTGFDAPCVDMLAFLRPTDSASLYVQMAGRGMRIKDGKKDCLVLDFAGNIDKHGPVNKINPPKHKRPGSGEAPIKECDECFMLVPASATQCKYCGYIFPINTTPKIKSQASASEILDKAGIAPVEKLRVTDVRFTVHKKQGSPDIVKVSYFDGLRLMVNEYICLLHEGYAGEKARKWWSKHVKDFMYNDILEAVEVAQNNFVTPQFVEVQKQGKYLNVVGYTYGETFESKEIKEEVRL